MRGSNLHVRRNIFTLRITPKQILDQEKFAAFTLQCVESIIYTYALTTRNKIAGDFHWENKVPTHVRDIDHECTEYWHNQLGCPKL